MHPPLPPSAPSGDSAPNQSLSGLCARTAGYGLAAGALSSAVLLWRGRTDAGSAAAPLNAVTHWLWPRRALWRDDVSLRYTGTGVAVHLASSMLSGGLYAWLRGRRRQPTALNAVTDAAAVTALAAAVDLKLVPDRLTPGFEHRLQTASLAGVYVALAAGLALGGLWSARPVQPVHAPQRH